MSCTPSPGTSAADRERYVLFEIQCCMFEMNSALKIVDAALNRLSTSIETLNRRRRTKVAEPHYRADAMPGTTLSFS